MLIFFMTFLVLLIVIVLMALGVMIKNKELKGSCGGLGGLNIAKECNCDNPCDKRKKILKNKSIKEISSKEI